MLEEVPTEELQPAEAAAAAEKDRRRAAGQQDRHLGRPGLRVLLRRLPRRRLPAARAAGSQGAAADREHALDGELAVRSPDVAALDADRRSADARDRRGDHRQPRRRRLSRRVGRRARGDGPVAGRRGRARAAAGSGLRSRSASPRATCRNACCCSCGTSASKARRPRRSSPSTCGCCRTIRCPRSPRKLGHDDRRSQGAHRDHPAPRSEAGQPLQPDAVAVRHSRRLRRQGRGSVRRGAERGRPAAAAHQPGLPPAARQGRARTATRRAPT